MTINALLDKTEQGFKQLNLPEKYVTPALQNIRTWLTEDIFKPYAPQIESLINAEKWDFLLESFYRIISFGTGGRRGMVGIGPNRINKWTIRASAQGHAQYLMKTYGETAQKRGVVLTYDVRKFEQKGIYNDDIPNPVMGLDCKDLAVAAAEVYAANGIMVYMFDDVRSTPELSFAIRHLSAISGDMFSASHNLPTDNGKKVYDEFGGQLIPPYDQILVDEVTKNVTEIKATAFNEAVAKGLVTYIGKEIDDAYVKAVCGISLSASRDIKILFSPLHGTGITSVYPVLKNLNFNVTLDSRTSNMSGAFENVTFNIPNPEVVESFDQLKSSADNAGADIIISSDPDADRIGIMAREKDGWTFLNGNEIGIILSEYSIEKYRRKNLLNKDCVIIKTQVTTSLIEKIAAENGIQCIGDLLVGFKYIGHEMNKLEKENRHKGFIFGTEESHGYIMGNYCRDKDAAGAAVWLSELAAELKEQQRTLPEYLDEIYSRYGYCHNYLTEIRLLGAKGMDQISLIMDHLREKQIDAFDGFKVSEKIDRLEGEPQPFLSDTDKSSRNVLIFNLENVDHTQSMRMTIRPSGTEPKIKMYFEVFGNPFDIKNLEHEKNKIVQIRETLEKIFMQYCYTIIDIDFPERGFLLFWQLPLNAKLKYFDIEDQIVQLKNIKDPGQRKNKLNALLDFLGANPVEKVNKAFIEKYNTGIMEYLGLR